MRRGITLALVGLLVTGCTLGPDYRRPLVPAPEGWRDGEPAADPASLADLPWWGPFEDQELRGLVQAALDGSKDVRIAVVRVEQARAQLGLTRSTRFPEVNAGASATTNRCRRRSWNGGPTSGWSSRTWWPPTPASAWPRPPSSLGSA
jgi:multidrug efflux system outer membrane protein